MMKTPALLICYYLISSKIVKHGGCIEEVTGSSQRSKVEENPSRISKGAKNETSFTGFKRFDISQLSKFNLFSPPTSQEEGKPYGDNESYEPIGDGVYLLTDGIGKSGKDDETSKSNVKDVKGSVKDNFPDTQRSINDILSNLDEEDKNIIDDGKKGATQTPVAVNNNNGVPPAGERVAANDLVVPIDAKQNVEDVFPTEVNMIKDIEGSLGRDDRRANQYENNNFQHSDIDPQLDSAQQPVFKASEMGTFADHFAEEKKDLTVSKRTSDTDSLISQIKEADKNRKDYAGSVSFNIDNKVNDIAAFAPQEESKLNDNISSRKLKEEKKIKSVDRLHNLNPDDTNFFINDEKDRGGRKVTLSDNKDINARNEMTNVSEKFKAYTKMSKGKNGTKMPNSVYVTTTSRRNCNHHSKKKVYKHKNAKKEIEKHKIERTKQPASKQDSRLNTSNLQSGGNHQGVVTVIRTQDTNEYITKHGSVAGQAQFRIISSKTEKPKLKINVVKKTNTPVEEYAGARRGTKKFITNGGGNNLQIDHDTVEKVNAALSEQDKKMFTSSPNDFNVASSNVNLQQERSVGQEGQLLGIESNMNDGVSNINSQPVLQSVGQEKHLLGIASPIKTVTRDMFVQPEHEEQDKQMFSIPSPMKVVDSDDNLQATHVIGQNNQMLGIANTMKVGDSNVNLQTERVTGKGNSVKEYNDVSVQDGINSEELKDAINDSDLKGLKQIRTELDAQDLRTAMEYFGKDERKESPNDRAVEHLVQRPMEMISTVSKINNGGVKDVNYSDVTEEEKPKNIKMYDNVNILSRLMELMSKQNITVNEGLNVKVENATQMNDYIKNDNKNDTNNDKNNGKNNDKNNNKNNDKNTDKNNDKSSDKNNDVESKGHDKESNTLRNNENPSLEDFAKKIEEFMNRRKESGDQTLSNGDKDNKEPKEAISLELNNILSIIQKGNHHNMQDSSNSNDNFELNSKQVSKPIQSPTKDNLQEKLAAEKERNSISIEMIDNLFKGKHTETEEKLAVEKLLTSGEGEGGGKEKTFSTGAKDELQINGGKILGGNVRGGRILGGIVLGGNITGGEMDGGRITGGTFKDGLFINGLMEDGVIEGGKIRGGIIRGGVIKAGVVDGGIISGGIMSGGELINGSIEGGLFRGGEIYGGVLKSGQMDGGTLKAGMINGGTMKGGIIDGGSLEGGVMLAGEIRGGVVKSGVIRGGIIDKGVVISDTEIGPGVEIHEGLVKGGKITASTRTFGHDGKTSSLGSELKKRVYHSDENRSNIMYSIKITKDGINNSDDSEVSRVMSKTESSNNEKALTTEKTMSRPLIKNATIDNKERKEMKKEVLANKNHIHPSNKDIPLHALYDEGNITLLKKNSSNTIKHDNRSTSTTNNDTSNNSNHIRSHNNNDDPTIEKHADAHANVKYPHPMVQIHGNKYLHKSKKELSLPSKLVANWELSNGNFNTIKGNPGPDLRMFNGVEIRNGHAILDGLHGYLDAGDFQGECFSDPEVCSFGFTVQMTLKVYTESFFSSSQQFIMDSGATLNNSRGISLWLTRGRIYGLVATREKTWCINTLYPYIEKWISLTLTWKSDIGMQLYINCVLFDQSSDHSETECGICTNCHETDDSTRLMFGRPNKGPHYAVIHMAVGIISLYEKFSNTSEIETICGKEGTTSKPVNHTATYLLTPPIRYPAPQSRHPAIFVIKPVMSLVRTHHIDSSSQVAWPTPRTEATRQAKKVRITAVKWPKPAAMVAYVPRTSEVKHVPIFPARTRIVNLKEKDVEIKDLQLSEDEIPLLHFMEGDEDKRTKITSYKSHRSLESSISALKHR